MFAFSVKSVPMQPPPPLSAETNTEPRASARAAPRTSRKSSTVSRDSKAEQLRALEHGYKIKVVVTKHESFGVDIPDDLSKILKRLEEIGD